MLTTCYYTHSYSENATADLPLYGCIIAHGERIISLTLTCTVKMNYSSSSSCMSLFSQQGDTASRLLRHGDVLKAKDQPQPLC